MRKSHTTAFLLLLFLYRKTYILFENIFEETQFILLHSHCCFFHVAGYWRCSNTNANIDIHWFCKRHTSIQNTWQQTRYFKADSDSNVLFLLFIYFRQVPSIQEKYINLDNQFHYKQYNEWIEILAKCFSSSIIVFSMKLLVILFIRKKNICQGIILVHSIQVTESTYCRFVFQTMYTSKICT